MRRHIGAHPPRLRGPDGEGGSEQAGLLSAMEPAMLGWAVARDRGEDSASDSDDPPPEVLGRS